MSRGSFLLTRDQYFAQFSQLNLMPFAHIHYRCIRSSNYNYQKRRCCFIFGCLLYALIFAAAGQVCLGLWVELIQKTQGHTCSVCQKVGATTPCGFQTCSFSFGDCMGLFGGGLYPILTIVFLAYAVYEIVLMICTLCHGSALQYIYDEAIIVEPNQQLIDMAAYPQEYTEDYKPSQMDQNYNDGQ